MAERPSRRSRDQTKKLVLDAAVDLVRIEGLGAEPTTVSYQKVFDHLEKTTGVRVTRASVHERIWASQEDFQFEVLLQLSEPDSVMAPTYDAALEIYNRTEGLAPMERARQIARVAASLNLNLAENDSLFYSWIGITMSVAKDRRVSPERTAQLRNAVAATYARFEGSGQDTLRALCGLVGIRPRLDLFADPEDGFLMVARLGNALSEGSSVRTRFDASQLPDVELRTGPRGEFQTWSTFAAGYWALIESLFEIDPAAHPNLVAGD